MKIMEKEFIPYEQALALKELGFDEPCLAFYWITGKFYITAEYHNCTGFHKQNQLGDYNYDSISAPTFSQAFRWFREKNIFYCIAPSSEIGKYHVGYFDKEWTLLKNNNEVPIKYSYEEAELECLKKLIEIVKQKLAQVKN